MFLAIEGLDVGLDALAVRQLQVGSRVASASTSGSVEVMGVIISALPSAMERLAQDGDRLARPSRAAGHG